MDPVAHAIADSWRTLAGGVLRLRDAAAAPSATDSDYAFAIDITCPAQAPRPLLLRIAAPLLDRLAARMFDITLDAVSDAQRLDAGKELANILGAICLLHLPALAGGRLGLPRRVDQGGEPGDTRTTAIASFMSAEREQDLLSLSLTDPSL